MKAFVSSKPSYPCMNCGDLVFTHGNVGACKMYVLGLCGSQWQNWGVDMAKSVISAFSMCMLWQVFGKYLTVHDWGWALMPRNTMSSGLLSAAGFSWHFVPFCLCCLVHLFVCRSRLSGLSVLSEHAPTVRACTTTMCLVGSEEGGGRQQQGMGVGKRGR